MNPNTTFLLNGEPVCLADCDPRESLLRWLKRRRLTGTKEGCADGDCGACTVALIATDRDGTSHLQAVNSCLLPMGVLPAREVITVEGLAEGQQLHPAQQALVDSAGSQCGYCTPGFVMSLFVGLHEDALDDHAIAGNLCRCTGYGPIRQAAARLASDKPADVRFAQLKSQPREPLPASQLPRFFSPTNVSDALTLKAQHADSLWFAGGTDLGVNLSHGQPLASVLIALDRIESLRKLAVSDELVRIGAGVPLTTLESALHGIFPALDEMLPWFAGRQVRNRATLGGNLGSASPIGDLLPVLLALDAIIHLRDLDGVRDVPAADFFLDYRKTARRGDELIEAVSLPRRTDLWSSSAKVAKRQTDDISIVAVAFALARDSQGFIIHARLAFGGVAAIPKRALATEAFLLGKQLDSAVILDAADRLRAEFEPLSDHRASSDYRRALCANLFLRFVNETTPSEASPDEHGA
ncbi:MAG: xanthine dehydrogenase small subunit [Pseudomarimonas sp.]